MNSEHNRGILLSAYRRGQQGGCRSLGPTWMASRAAQWRRERRTRSRTSRAPRRRRRRRRGRARARASHPCRDSAVLPSQPFPTWRRLCREPGSSCPRRQSRAERRPTWAQRRARPRPGRARAARRATSSSRGPSSGGDTSPFSGASPLPCVRTNQLITHSRITIFFAIHIIHLRVGSYSSIDVIERAK